MARQKSSLELAAGKLISAVQKEWNRHAGEGDIERQSEEVVYKAHDLLKAKTPEAIKALLGEKSVAEHLGKDWLSSHPQVMQYVGILENEIANSAKGTK